MYTTLSDWLAFAAARGDVLPAEASAEDQAAALQRGDDYVRRTYVSAFATSVDLTSDEVLAALAEAVHLAAGLELASVGSLSATLTTANQKTLTKVGDLEWDVPKASEESPMRAATPRHTGIEALLAPYLATDAKGQFIGVGALLV